MPMSRAGSVRPTYGTLRRPRNAPSELFQRYSAGRSDRDSFRDETHALCEADAGRRALEAQSPLRVDHAMPRNRGAVRQSAQRVTDEPRVRAQSGQPRDGSIRRHAASRNLLDDGEDARVSASGLHSFIMPLRRARAGVGRVAPSPDGTRGARESPPAPRPAPARQARAAADARRHSRAPFRTEPA